MLGEPKYITTDDRLAVQDAGYGYTWSNGKRYSPVNAKRSDSGAWWLPILEKAYAKFTLTYASLSGGNEWEALRAMTGMPVANYQTSSFSSNQLYDFIKYCDTAGYVMTAGCYGSSYGLVAGHAYSMLGVNDDTGRIVMRNPWSSESYRGPGGD